MTADAMALVERLDAIAAALEQLRRDVLRLVSDVPEESPADTDTHRPIFSTNI